MSNINKSLGIIIVLMSSLVVLTTLEFLLTGIIPTKYLSIFMIVLILKNTIGGNI